MAELSVHVPRDLDWSITDRLVLLVGSEGAADLASSTPTGGVNVLDVAAWDSDVMRGGFGVGPFGLEALGFASTAGGASGGASGGGGFGEGAFGLGALGINDAPQLVLEHRYTPTDLCACLPVGVAMDDTAGNRSAVIEALVQLRDTPVGARRVSIGSTGSALQARVSWAASPNV